MTTVGDIAAWLEDFAPSRLAEAWDNVGLLMGDPTSMVERIMTCLTVTDATASEAIEGGVAAIVAHHPILFKGAKSLRADQPGTAAIWRLVRARIAVLSPHTAFDNTRGGINDGLAARLELAEVRSLRPGPNAGARKVVVFVPKGSRKAVLDAAFEAGAGSIGAYRECSFTGPGRGTFFGTEGTNPAVGEPGRRETVEEWRIELACSPDRLAPALAAIRTAHPYEEPAIDVLDLRDVPLIEPGVGRFGVLPEPESLGKLARRVANLLKSPATTFVGDPDRRIRSLAICCGAGDDFLGEARRVGADALLTGEARFHRGLEAEALGLGLIVAGHQATERPGVEDLAGRIAAGFPGVEAWASRAEVDPFRSVEPEPRRKK